MITPMDIYLITRLDGICTMLTILTILSVLVLIGFITGYFCEYTPPDWHDDKRKRLKPFLKGIVTSGLALLVLGICGIIVPSTKEMAAIIVVPRIANSQTVNELGAGVKDLALSWLEQLKPGVRTTETNLKQ